MLRKRLLRLVCGGLASAENRAAHAHNRRAFQNSCFQVLRHTHGQRIQQNSLGRKRVFQLTQSTEPVALQFEVSGGLRDRHQSTQMQPRQCLHVSCKRQYLVWRNPAFAGFTTYVDLDAHLQRRQAGRPGLRQALCGFTAVYAVHPRKMFSDRPRLVALNRPNEMPFQRQAFERENFFQAFLRVIFAEGGLSGAVCFIDFARRKGLAHRDQLYLLRRSAGGFGACCNALLHGLQSQSDCGHIEEKRGSTRSL